MDKGTPKTKTEVKKPTRLLSPKLKSPLMHKGKHIAAGESVPKDLTDLQLERLKKLGVI